MSQSKKTYVMALCLKELRSNLMFVVQAHNDYDAIMAGMKAYSIHCAEQAPGRKQEIISNWREEKKAFMRAYPTYDALHNGLCMLGIIISKPKRIDNLEM